jgi:hypothetical protein
MPAWAQWRRLHGQRLESIIFRILRPRSFTRRFASIVSASGSLTAFGFDRFDRFEFDGISL